MKKQKGFTPKGFTLIEILLIVAIISILVTVALTMLGQARKNARMNSAKTTLKSVLTTIVSCNNGTVNTPNPSENGTRLICNNVSGAFWPKLPGGYTYITTGANYSVDCQFEVDTNGDTSGYLRCTCVSQICTY